MFLAEVRPDLVLCTTNHAHKRKGAGLLAKLAERNFDDDTFWTEV